MTLAGIACSDGLTPMQNGKANDYLFINAGASSVTITLKHQGGAVAPADKTLSLAAGGYGLFRIEAADLVEYMDAGGLVQFTYSAVTSLTVIPIAH